jgi:Protein of unknown function (DUF1552)
MKYNRMTRRMFLQSSGTSLMAIPFLTSLLPKEAWGQTATPVKRFVSLFSSFELGHNSYWLPRIGGSETNLPQPNRILNPGGGHHPVRWQPLSEFISSSSTPLAPLYGTTLNSHLQHINIFRGMDHALRYGHGSGQLLGAMNTSEGISGPLQQIQTIDNLLAANATINPSRRLIYAGAAGGWEGYSLNTSGVANTRIDWLDQLYNALFDNGNFPEGGTTTVPTNHPRRDVLSRVIEDYNRMMNSRNISAQDRIVLTNAMDKMSDVHRGLAGVTNVPSSCSHRSLQRPGGRYVADAGSSVENGRILVDMLTASIMCDTNRIFTIGLNQPYGQYSGFTDPVFNYLGDWHQEISHVPFGITSGRRNWEWVGMKQAYLISRIFAPLIQNLAAATDPSNGQSYLYNSLVQMSFESGQVHGHGSHPTILAGNGGGTITSGNYIDYSDRTKGAFGGADLFTTNPADSTFSSNYYGVHYNRYLVTLLQAMGLTPSQYEVDSRNFQIYNRTDIGSQNTNLTSVGGYGYVFGADRTSTMWTPATFYPELRFYDLNQFRNRLPMPA